MPLGRTDSPTTNKTEFMRFLNDSAPLVKCLARTFKEYEAKPNRTGNNFGFWLRMTRQPEFDRAYKSYWLKHPEHYTTPALT